MFETKIYTYGSEEAKAISEARDSIRKIEKGNYSSTYVDMPTAIRIMREFREKKGLGMKVKITLKNEVRLRKQNEFQKIFRTTVCPFTRLTFGKYRGQNQVGVAQWGAITLGEFRDFNLDNDEDAADWIILRLASCIEGSVNADKNTEIHYWEFNDLRAANTSIINKSNELVKITQLLAEMSGSEMLNLARIMNFSTSPGDEHTIKIVDIHGFLLGIAYENPGEFMAKYKDSNRTIHELIYSAIAIGTMQFSYVDGYKINGNNIGNTIEEATAFLRNDRQMFGHIKQEIIGSDIMAKRLETEKPEKSERKAILEDAMNKFNGIGPDEVIV